MEKRRVTKEDGRYLVFYSFGARLERPGAPGAAAGAPKPSPQASPRSAPPPDRMGPAAAGGAGAKEP
ncbi:MAG: hypothetical protein DIU82_11495 [Bacillota bacterium]|nr:MAG: hypothetical protein DIU82_11495 [Bacillota bacterium]